MQLVTETSENPLKILIVARAHNQIVSVLKKKLGDFQADIFMTTKRVANFSKYDVCFFVDYEDIIPNEFDDSPQKRIVYILFNENKVAQTLSNFVYEHKLHHIKIINWEPKKENLEKDIDTILWFAFSRSEDIFLHIYHENLTSSHKKKSNKKFVFPKLSFRSFFKPKNLVVLGIAFILLAQILFLPPLIIASWFHYQAGKSVQSASDENVKKYTNIGGSSLNIAATLYSIPKPLLHFFSLGIYFDNLFQVNASAHTVLESMMTVKKEGEAFAELLTIPDKTSDEKNELYKHKDNIFEALGLMQDNLILLSEKIPDRTEGLTDIKKTLTKASETVDGVIALEDHFDGIFAADREKKYLLLFANNMEIRPGGGFIGSFAIATVKDYSITELRMYDVYDADGQLKDQIDPPAPIVDYLNQTHWFLRDSAFEPDFFTNYLQAKRFLELELNEGDFDGGLLITTTAIQHILSAMDKLYVPDYQETITKDNFYIKAQLYAEDNFFPGSLKKKKFLGSVMNQMMLNLQNASYPALFSMMQKSLNEKQIVIYSEDPKLQALLEQNYWAGQTLTPKCNLDNSINCVLDYVFSYDANLGVNKANFFVKRPTKLAVSINENGEIKNTLTIKFINNSYPDVFPGGSYKNYTQLMLPPNTRIEKITIDGVNLERYDETNFNYKKVGFLLNVQPQSESTVEIVYELPTTIIAGEGVYQLIVQKQIGSPNYDFNLEFSFPDNLTIKNKNFSPLVKENNIHYNTSVSSDKIFVIEFSKK